MDTTTRRRELFGDDQTKEIFKSLSDSQYLELNLNGSLILKYSGDWWRMFVDEDEFKYSYKIENL